MITATLPMMLLPAAAPAVAEPPAPGTIAPFDAMLALLAPPLAPAPSGLRAAVGDAAISIDGRASAGAADPSDDADAAKEEALPIMAVPDAGAVRVTVPAPVMMPAAETATFAKPVSTAADEPRGAPTAPASEPTPATSSVMNAAIVPAPIPFSVVADRRPPAAEPAATVALDKPAEGRRMRATGETAPLPEEPRPAGIEPDRPVRPIASAAAKSLATDVKPRMALPSIASLAGEPVAADAGPRVLASSIALLPAESRAIDARPLVPVPPIASPAVAFLPADAGPRVPMQPGASLPAEPALPGIAARDPSPPAPTVIEAGAAIEPAVATPRVRTIAPPTELATATAPPPPRGSSFAGTAGMIADGRPDESDAPPPRDKNDAIVTVAPRLVPTAAAVADAPASTPIEASARGAARPAAGTPPIVASALPASPVADVATQVLASDRSAVAGGRVSPPAPAPASTVDPVAEDRPRGSVDVANMPVAAPVGDGNGARPAVSVAKADSTEPVAPAGRADAAAIVRVPLAAPAPAPDRVAMFPRFSGATGVATVRAPAAARPAGSAADADADVSGLDLAAIFPLAGNAPLTVAFVRPVAASVPQRAADAPGMPAPAADPAAPEPRAIDGVTQRDAAQAAAVLAALPPIPAAPAIADGAGTVQAPAIPAEVSVQHHLDVAHDGVWLDRLARDIAASADHESRMRFQLNPERLGALQVEIKPGTDGASVRFTADSEAARTLIVDAQPKLIADARAHGMKIADTQVEISGQQSGGYGQGSGGAGGLAQQQQQQQSGGQRSPLFDRPAAAVTRPAPAGQADKAARAERYA